MTAGPVLTGTMIRLRPIREDDAAGRYELVNDGESRRLTGAMGATDMESVRAWCINAATRPGRVDWAVCAVDGDEYLGEVSLVQLNRKSACANLRMSMRREWRGRGYSAEAVPLVLAHAFAHEPDGLGLHRVGVHVLSNNMRVQALYETMGFTQEGRLRHTHRDGDRWVDTIVSSILSEEFERHYGAESEAVRR